MNVLNPIPLAIAGSAEIDSAPNTYLNEAHIIRSKIVGRCAAVEHWLVTRISDFEKPEMMLSKKLDQLIRIVDQNPTLFKKSDRLKIRISEFSPFAAFRSEIVHSEMKMCLVDGVPNVFFENSAQTCKPMLRKTLVRSMDQFELAWSDLAKAANNLTNHPIKESS